MFTKKIFDFVKRIKDFFIYPEKDDPSYEIFCNNYRRECIDSIRDEILTDFYCNLEFVPWSKGMKNTILLGHNPDGFYRSYVKYNGKVAYVAFLDIRQTEEALYKIANYFYKGGKKCL